MNNKKLVILAVLVVASVGAIFGMAMGLQGSAASTDCGHPGVKHTVTIRSDTVTPVRLTGKLCDVVMITNLDPTPREIGFGAHDHHVAYDGITERTLAQNDSFTFTLDKKGEFGFHDHFHDEVAATFTVE
jgi:hypothetical protein